MLVVGFIFLVAPSLFSLQFIDFKCLIASNPIYHFLFCSHREHLTLDCDVDVINYIIP
jgi:hypothetical protein